MTEVSVFFVSATEVAVTVTSRMQVCCVPEVQFDPVIFVGSGIFCGAVKITVLLVEFAGMLPESALQAVAVPVVCFPVLSKVEVA